MSGLWHGSGRWGIGSSTSAIRGSYGAGDDKDHVAVHHATRVAYIEVLADEKKPTMICLSSRAIA
jgi:hypothetical protein